ncbi:MAG: pantoate--beta-alanine ligase [bacterium]
MKILKTVIEMQNWSDAQRLKKRSIGFVPTMGAIHDGHSSLVRRSRQENQATVVSIFVNPAQFGPQEDFHAYPRPRTLDLKILRAHNVDLVFAPTVHEMYKNDFSTCVEESVRSKGLCADTRPDHFRGVTTIVTKLFIAVNPHNAYFGEKDYQQLKIIQKMVKDLGFNIKVIGCPVVRESDGLARSSRNKYLDREHRAKALLVYSSLQKAVEMIKSKNKISDIYAYIHRLWQQHDTCRLEYIRVVDPETLEEKHTFVGRIRVLIAATVGNTRLIDTIEIRR